MRMSSRVICDVLRDTLSPAGERGQASQDCETTIGCTHPCSPVVGIFAQDAMQGRRRDQGSGTESPRSDAVAGSLRFDPGPQSSAKP